MTASGAYIFNKLKSYATSAPWRSGSIGDETSSSSSGGSGGSGGVTPGAAYEALTNGDFEGVLWSPWQRYAADALNGAVVTSITSTDGTDIVFSPSGAEAEDYELQLYQDGVNIQPGYSYVLSFGGNTLESGHSAPVWIGWQLLGNPTTGEGFEDYTKRMWNLTGAYKDFEAMEWKNCDVSDSKARFFINGGESAVDFKIAWVSLRATPIECE
jgi:hypothetical protein